MRPSSLIFVKGLTRLRVGPDRVHTYSPLSRTYHHPLDKRYLPLKYLLIYVTADEEGHPIDIPRKRVKLSKFKALAYPPEETPIWGENSLTQVPVLCDSQNDQRFHSGSPPPPVSELSQHVSSTKRSAGDSRQSLGVELPPVLPPLRDRPAFPPSVRKRHLSAPPTQSRSTKPKPLGRASIELPDANALAALPCSTQINSLCFNNFGSKAACLMRSLRLAPR